MSAECCSPGEVTGAGADPQNAEAVPWWKDRAIVVPVLSGVSFAAGLICEWSGSYGCGLPKSQGRSQVLQVWQARTYCSQVS